MKEGKGWYIILRKPKVQPEIGVKGVISGQGRGPLETNGVLDMLKKIRTPIIYDTIGIFNVRPRNEGYMDPTVRCMFPSLEPLAGYACTGKVVGESPPAEGETVVPWREVLQYVSQCKQPSVMVVQDLDQPPSRGCAWGDMAAGVFHALGCVGVVTNGGVRDLKEVEHLRFPLFASSAVVGDAYVRYVEIGTPVKVGGQVINPGDLIHADVHGVLVIPKEIPLGDLLGRAREFLDSERSIIDYCMSGEFELDEYCNRMDDHEKKWGGHTK